MTLVTVLLFGFGAVLIMSAIETDKKTGKSVSVFQTISDIWNDTLDFSQSGTPGQPATQSGGAVSYQSAATMDYLKTRSM